MTGNTDMTTSARKPGWEHIPVYPRGFIGLRIAQLALAVIALGLTAFGVWGVAISGVCLVLFVAITTIITTVWLLVAHYAKPSFYNYWAVMALDIFHVVFWLVAFAVLASQVSTLYSYLGMSGGRGSYYYSSSYYTTSAVEEAWLACQAAAAAVGGVLFVLFVVSLVFHSMALHRHRAAGLHCTALPTSGQSASGPAPYAEKANPVQTYPAPVYTQPAQGYPQQQQPQQPQQQYYDPSAVTSPMSATQGQQGYYPQQTQPQQQQQQVYGDAQQQPYQAQQPVYPPPQTVSPPPLSAQYTGSSTGPVSVPQPQNNAVEVPAQTYQQQPQQQQQL